MKTQAKKEIIRSRKVSKVEQKKEKDERLKQEVEIMKNQVFSLNNECDIPNNDQSNEVTGITVKIPAIINGKARLQSDMKQLVEDLNEALRVYFKLNSILETPEEIFVEYKKTLDHDPTKTNGQNSTTIQKENNKWRS